MHRSRRSFQDALVHGWFIDQTPHSGGEFLAGQALDTSAAAGRIDLQTAISQEIGHFLGLDDRKRPPLAIEIVYWQRSGNNFAE